MLFIRAEPDGAEIGVPSLLSFNRPRKPAEKHGIVNNTVCVSRVIPWPFTTIKA